MEEKCLPPLPEPDVTQRTIERLEKENAALKAALSHCPICAKRCDVCFNVDCKEHPL